MRTIIFALGLLFATAASAGAVGLETYGGLPSVEDFSISPDGKSIAYATNVDNKRVVVIRGLEDGKPLGALAVGDQKLRDLYWADDTRLIMFVSSSKRMEGFWGPKQELFMAQAYDLRTHKQIPLLENIDKALNLTFGTPLSRLINGHLVLFVDGIQYRDWRATPTLFAIDLDASHTTMVLQGGDNTEDWVVDDKGNPIVLTEYNDRAGIWSLSLRQNGDWKKVYEVDAPLEKPAVLGIGPDGRSIWVSMIKDGTYAGIKFSLVDGKQYPAPELAGTVNAAAILDKITHRIIGLYRQGSAQQYTFFSPTDQDVWNAVSASFASENVDLVSTSGDRKHMVLRVDGPHTGSAYFVVDLNKGSAERFADAYTGVGPNDIAEVQVVSYNAADGTRIPAYLTLPKGRDRKNLPLIVLPHGGPAARDEPELDWWSQAIAAQGYAVLQPEFRGSDGYGWAHLAAGFGEWGRKMQSDLSDGVHFLAGQGIVDPKRVCIVGASYGGYAAMAGATLDKGMYRCAVAVAGLSNLHNMLAWEQRRYSSGENVSVLRYWRRFMGASVNSDPRLDEISPALHVTSDTPPVLLIHGKEDTVVPIAQSEDMESALERAGRPVKFVKLDGEDHWLSRPATRLKMLQETIAFLKANNPPD
ncbi:MAG: S9 family peptidase [Alphaproteobacteria bacterium]|nr:S9 family peptidase [Alphaproteobacteria bacterium]